MSDDEIVEFEMDSMMIDDHIWQAIKDIPKENVHATVKRIIAQAYFDSRDIIKTTGGDLPIGLERMIEESLKPPYDFRPLLKRFIDGELLSHLEDTRKRPNRRFGYRYPGKKAVMKAKIGIVADTSASMDDKELGMIVKNLKNINEYAQIVLFEVDTCIHNLWEFNTRIFKNMLLGGGGTVFNDVFKVMDNYKENKGLLDNIPYKQRVRAHMLIQDIKALIIITDGGICGLPRVRPRIPVLWALTSKCQTVPVRWGKVIYLDNKPDNHRRY